MRISRLFAKTVRQVPAEAETVSHRLLVQSGMISQLTAGVYTFLPLGWRALRKIEEIIRQEMDAVGGQEVRMPVLQPLEIWQETGRDVAFGQGLFTLTDRRDHKLALGPTHEEVVTALARRNIQSYRDLPVMVYQIQTKFRDEPRSRGGLIRVREFPMKDAYSFHADEADLDVTYRAVLQAYKNMYARCGLSSMVVEADSGAIGGKDSHEFMVLAESGENEIIYCSTCDYAANVEKAKSLKSLAPVEEPLPLREIATPGMKTIEQVAGFVGVPHNQTLKAVFYYCDGRVIFVAIRGDLEVNEVKLKNSLKCLELRLATDEEVTAAGLVAGAASPVGLSGVKVVADSSITLGSNFVSGGNKPDVHLLNTNYPRDFAIDLMTDIATARPGDRCILCKGELHGTRGIEVGHIFKLGTVFSEKLGALFLDREGMQKPLIMGCYGIGVGRLLAAAVEQNHDDKGIIWPAPIAPYHVYLCALGMDNEEVASAAEKLYGDLTSAGLEVLFDDRIESPGVKFNDADLLGMPLRVTVSPRTLKSQSAELKKRAEKEFALLPLAEVVEKVKGCWRNP